jgi:hypothetical protein
VRRDCEPHRADVLLFLGRLSLLCGALSLCVAFPGVVGLPLAVAVKVLCMRDLRRAEAGLMDPRGNALLRKAWRTADRGALLGVAALIVWGEGLLVALLR